MTILTDGFRSANMRSLAERHAEFHCAKVFIIFQLVSCLKAIAVENYFI